MKEFITKHERNIVGVLSGWDRIRFRGTLRNLAVTKLMMSWLLDQKVLDPVLGLCHVRIQSWLPFNVHVCVNGREWLCRPLRAAGVGFTRQDNCLVDVADVEAAQGLLNAQPWAGGLEKRGPLGVL